MDYSISEVANRVRELREITGLTQGDMAEKIGITLQEYQSHEDGKIDFGFGFIYKCAGIFGVEMKDILEGESPSLSLCTITRKGEGMPIVKKSNGFVYDNLAPSFKDKIGEPFRVTIPYTEKDDMYFSSHTGQELDIVVSGSVRLVINGKEQILNEGDCAYYNSSVPHGLKAIGGKDCEMYAVVMKPNAAEAVPNQTFLLRDEQKQDDLGCVSDKFVQCDEDSEGRLVGVHFKNEETFNFGYDVVDELAAKCPAKTAMLWVGGDKSDRRFTFSDMKRYSNKTANYFESLGIKRGDKVMLVLKRHYQYWFAMVALHKMGVVVIPATNQLVEHDFSYRYKAAGVNAIVCTADGDVSHQAELAAKEFPDMLKIMVGGSREGWHDYNADIEKFSDVYERKADTPCGSDTMLMIFTSGTTGYPRVAVHSYKYPLGHYITAKYWHNVNPDGFHFSISDTGWGKALWGKIYGQWLCEAPLFTYDFDRFKSEDILPMFKKYNITTFCAPPTMYRFFIKEDLSKYDLSSIQHATTAGEALNPEVFNQFKKATGLTIMEGFGQTETTLVIGNLIGSTVKLGSMGQASPLYDVHILDGEGNDCKSGDTGEICIRTKDGAPCGLFTGYYMDKEKTDNVWYDGYYHTGDTAYLDEDGFIWYVGRIDDVIKSSGYRIGPFEIESVIMELPYVLECAITAVPDPIRGQIVKATIVLTRGTEGSDALVKEIQTYVKTHTAPYKYPRIVEFVDELPKTVSGKVRRVAIREKDKEAN